MWHLRVVRSAAPWTVAESCEPPGTAGPRRKTRRKKKRRERKSPRPKAYIGARRSRFPIKTLNARVKRRGERSSRERRRRVRFFYFCCRLLSRDDRSREQTSTTATTSRKTRRARGLTWSVVGVVSRLRVRTDGPPAREERGLSRARGGRTTKANSDRRLITAAVARYQPFITSGTSPHGRRRVGISRALAFRRPIGHTARAGSGDSRANR